MWRSETKRDDCDRWRDNLVLVAPEANPHEFVRRYLRGKTRIAATYRNAELQRFVAPSTRK